MARTNDPDSATSQFFINSVDNDFLDYQNSNNPGYAVFGFVTQGMDVVDTISEVETGARDVPEDPVIIETIRRREGQLNFTKVEQAYAIGEVIELSLKEVDIKREEPLDLWVALVLPNAELLFLTEENDGFFSKTAIPFKRAVSIEENSHQILSYTVLPGLSGHYTFMAIFNQTDTDLSDLTHTIRSNFVMTEIDIVD